MAAVCQEFKSVDAEKSRDKVNRDQPTAQTMTVSIALYYRGDKSSSKTLNAHLNDYVISDIHIVLQKTKTMATKTCINANISCTVNGFMHHITNMFLQLYDEMTCRHGTDADAGFLLQNDSEAANV